MSINKIKIKFEKINFLINQMKLRLINNEVDFNEIEKEIKQIKEIINNEKND